MWIRRVVWLVASVALIAGAGVSGPAWADPPEPVVEELVRPDWVSATVTARSTGQRVEVLSEKSETGRVWVFPDGSVEEEQAAAAVRFLDETSETWRDIDTNLQATSEGVRPVSMPVDVRLGMAGEPAVVFDADAAGEVKFELPDVVLPTPVLDGPTAVYPEVLDGVDLSVEVRSVGFEVLWIVKTPEAADALMEEYGVEGQLRLPTRISTGGDVAADSGGVVQVKDATGEVVGSFADPVMWDTNTETPGEQGVVEPVVMEISAEPVGASGTQVDVVADGGWLSDPERVFPVVIDPTYALDSRTPAFDAFVQQGITSDQSGSAELKLGNNGAGQIARTFMNFDSALFKGRQVISSTLSLYESWSYNCTARPFSVYAAGLASTSTNWASQPSVGVKHATLNVAAGYSASCPGARVQLDTTSYAKAMSTALAAQVGMLLRADNETDVVSWKRFHSSEGQNKPVISVRYNRAPNVPAVPTVGGLTNAMTQSGVKPFVAGTPKLSVVVKDADANTSKANFAAFTSATSTATPATLCQSGLVASGGTATCTAASGVLKDNTTVWIRATLGDEVGGWSGWGPAQEARVAFSTPVTPAITCPTANGSWGDTAKPKETCVITMPVNPAQATSAPVKVKWSINGAAWQEVTKTQPSPTSPNSHGVQMGGADGVHALRAVTISPTGKQSATQTYQFGYGKPKLTSPSAGMVTHGEILVTATGQPKGAAPAVTGSIQWRIKGSNDNAWVSAPNNAWSTTATTSGTTFNGRLNTAALEGLADGSGVTVAKRVSTVIQLRVVLDYGTSGKTNTDPVDVVRVPHAFGAGFPVTEAGGGQVALWTGELQISDTDAELSTPDGGLSISRVHSTYAGAPNVANSVFGPGWVAAFDGDEMGTSGMELIDNTPYDGTLVLVDADGTALPFSKTPGSEVGNRRTTNVFPLEGYLPVGADAEESGLRLNITQAGGVLTAVITDEDGIATHYTAPNPTGAAEANFAVLKIADPVVDSTTAYARNPDGRIDTITAGLPDGVTACPTTGSAPGCRVLKLNYGAGNRVATITALVNGEPAKVLATYVYDTSGRMTKATDTVTGLATNYTWTGPINQPRLASVTPPGQAAITYTYDTAGKLSKVTRPVPTTAGGGVSQLAAFAYDVAPANISGLGGLDTQFAGYDLPRTATTAFAVFGPDAPITGTPAAGNPVWNKADVWLTDPAGYTIHEASYGAGTWQLTANIYDADDNVTSMWDTRATAAIRDGDIIDIDAAATTTTFNEPIKGTDGTTVLVPAGTRVTDVQTPSAMIAPEGSIIQEMMRRHLHTDYDQGAPNNGLHPKTGRPYGLTTTTTVTAERLDNTVVETLTTTTTTGYGATAVDGTVTGWDLGMPTSTTLDMGATPDLVTEIRYDKRGRTVEQRKPGSTGTDAATRKTVYWSAGSNTRDVQCGNQPKWAGYVCKVGPAAQPPGTPLPVNVTRDYGWDGQLTTEIETSGTVTRTTTTTYDPVTRRPVTTSTAATGLPQSISEPAITTSYNTAGQVTGTTSTAGNTAMTYDTWGRQLTYTTTPAGGANPETTTTTYNQLGDVTKVTTPKGVTNLVWDGTDAAGNVETRGLLTKVTNNVNGYESVATAAYDAHGELVLERLPGKISRETTFDLTGELISQTYNGTITDPDTGTTTDDQPWVGWSIGANAAGQITREWNPGTDPQAAIEGATTGTQSESADLRYAYDKAGRLTTVTDRITATPTADVTCDKRTYGFDQRGNRTTHTTATGQGDGCTNLIETSNVTRSYDIADRPLTGANGQGTYTYDPLGRQTVIPAADAPHPAGGDIGIEYRDSDAARRVHQGDTTIQYDLDGSGRRAAQTSYTGGTLTTPGPETSKTTNHYTDASDNPGWITHGKPGQTTTTTVYGNLVSDDLSLSITTDAAGTQGELALTTPRGDIAATITLPTAATTATGLDSWTRYTEYGNPTTTPPTGNTGAAGNGYGWLGAHQRTTTTIGLTLMGARLYNPTTGLFTSTDPVFGGNETTYSYPTTP